MKGGLSTMQALLAATATAADAIGVDAGRLEPGRLADIVLVDGDPLADISLLQHASRLHVIKDGRDVKPISP